MCVLTIGFSKIQSHVMYIDMYIFCPVFTCLAGRDEEAGAGVGGGEGEVVRLCVCGIHDHP